MEIILVQPFCIYFIMLYFFVKVLILNLYGYYRANLYGYDVVNLCGFYVAYLVF